MRLTLVKKACAAKPRVGGLAGWVLAAVQGLGAEHGPVKQMRLVETLALGGRKQLLLVSCGGERFLVGTGAESVQTIVRVRAEGASAGPGLVAKVEIGERP